MKETKPESENEIERVAMMRVNKWNNESKREIRYLLPKKLWKKATVAIWRRHLSWYRLIAYHFLDVDVESLKWFFQKSFSTTEKCPWNVKDVKIA